MLVSVAEDLAREVGRLRFGSPVTHVYNPLEYAWEAHREYLERYGRGPREIVMLGMNPGPWGMAQTGVPFGEVNIVRDWLGIRAEISKPKREHPKRPVEGLACRRSEVSGARLWGWIRSTWVEPSRFFARFFVANYCPLLFVEESGRNRTPDKLPSEERMPLLEICDRAVRRTVECLRPRLVIGVGAFAEDRARRNLGSLGIQVGRIPHPSPASPAANSGWVKEVMRALVKLGISVP